MKLPFGKMSIQRFKINIFGDAKVGKTSYVNWLLTNNFSSTYVPTLGVDVHVLHFTSNYGNIIFDVWDCAGEFKASTNMTLNSNYAIIMCDITNIKSIENINKWVEQFRNVIVCGNKIDKIDKHYNDEFDELPFEKVLISVKTLNNLITPFEILARMLTGHNDLVLRRYINKVKND
jgi:GTP-binding nuclear protein Ran